jgi:hypothetical protein
VECDQLIDAQPGVEQHDDDRLGHGASQLGVSQQPAALRGGEPLRGEWLSGNVGQVLGGVLDDAVGSGGPAEEPAQGREGSVDRGRLLALGQLGLVLAQVAGGGLQQRCLVVLGEPAGETLQVRQVQARGALADPGVVGQKGGQRLIRRKLRPLWRRDRPLLRRAASQGAGGVHRISDQPVEKGARGCAFGRCWAAEIGRWIRGVDLDNGATRYAERQSPNRRVCRTEA